QLEGVGEEAGDRAEHLPGAVNALAGFAREVAHDDLRNLPAGDPAPREDLVSHEIDPVPDLELLGDLAAERAAAAVDVVERGAEDPLRERVQPPGEHQARQRVMPLLLPA